ncbi:hypothetical protein Tco_1402783 [Tanacetum coccineum]
MESHELWKVIKESQEKVKGIEIDSNDLVESNELNDISKCLVVTNSFANKDNKIEERNKRIGLSSLICSGQILNGANGFARNKSNVWSLANEREMSILEVDKKSGFDPHLVAVRVCNHISDNVLGYSVDEAEFMNISLNKHGGSNFGVLNVGDPVINPSKKDGNGNLSNPVGNGKEHDEEQEEMKEENKDFVICDLVQPKDYPSKNCSKA